LSPAANLVSPAVALAVAPLVASLVTPAVALAVTLCSCPSSC